MGAYLRRMIGKQGKAEGTSVAARKLARIIHGMIKSQRAYDEKEAFKLSPQSDARRREVLEKQAAAPGFRCTAVFGDAVPSTGASACAGQSRN
jgi:hypothetical protein